MISLVVNNITYEGFVNIEVKASYKTIPNYFTCTFMFEDKILFKINDEYILYINDSIYQKGFIVDITTTSSIKYGLLYNVRGVDYNNSLLNNSCGLYNYTDLYNEIPTPVSVKKILDFFNIKYTYEVNDVELFLQPNTTDSLWSVVKKVANYTNSNAVSNGNIIRFINTPDKKIDGILINNSSIDENNIFESSLKISTQDKIKDIYVINNLTSFVKQANLNIKSKNESVYFRDLLFTSDLTNYNKYLREYNNYDIIKYCCNIKEHIINNEVPTINQLINVYDDVYNIDTVLLIIDVCFKESRTNGVQLDMELIDPTIINLTTNKGVFGDVFYK